MDMSKVRVTNIMADGSICEDLRTYLDTHDIQLPNHVNRLIVSFIQDGRRLREAEEREKAKD